MIKWIVFILALVGIALLFNQMSCPQFFNHGTCAFEDTWLGGLGE